MQLSLSNRKLSLKFLLSVIVLTFSAVSMATADEYRAVQHAMGNSSVPIKPQRVVTLFQGATDSAIALGITPVGVVESWAEKPTYHYLRKHLEGVTLVGLETQPNLEQIAALKPDLIIGTKARHEKIYPQLQTIAPTVLASTVYDFQYSLMLTGEATGRKTQADVIWLRWKERTQAFRKQLKLNQTKWPMSASILNVRADHLRLYLKESFPGAVLKDIGFEFPMKGSGRSGWGMKLKTKEALPSVNADVFFVILHSDQPVVEKNYQSWAGHPLWKVLDAPKHNQVYDVDRVSWLLSGGILGANSILDQLAEVYQLDSLAYEISTE